jgi:hypothetical protein
VCWEYKNGVKDAGGHSSKPMIVRGEYRRASALDVKRVWIEQRTVTYSKPVTVTLEEVG